MDVKAGDRIPLTKLNGEIREVVALDGTELKALWFDCPMCGDVFSHWHMIPFHPHDPVELEGLGKVWRQVSTDPDELTLAPSYNARCIHAFIRKGILEVL